MNKIYRHLTRFEHCESTTVSGWATCAAALKRCQLHDFRQFGRRSWADYPSSRWGWITDRGRCLGAGERPKYDARSGELLIAIELPFRGSGRDLKKESHKFVRRMNRLAAKG